MSTDPTMPVYTRLLRGYGPLVAFFVLFALMAALLPSVKSDTPTTVALPDQPYVDPTQPSTTPGADGEDTPETGTGTPGQPGTEGRVERRETQGSVQGSCPDRTMQIPGDPYSPPCVAFSGDNGGATSRGVSAEEIVVSARILDEKGFQQTLAALAGAEITDGPEDVRRTIKAYEQYFNERFQFYGRQLRIEFYDGKGSSTAELLGGGQAEAQADAIHVAQNIGAFAEINGATAPFADALFRQGVIAFGTPYLSRDWHVNRRPYNWSVATDCSIVAETAGELYVKQLGGKGAAFAGPGLQGNKRVLAGLSPENPWYAECHDDFEDVVRAGGFPADARINYRLDINSMSNQAANVVSRLKSDGATTVFCGCDPIFPVFLTTKAAEQGYNPEWVVVGVALTDHDLVGQLYDQEQWSRAYGVSFAGSIQPQRAGLGYAAYKTVRGDEPAFAAEIIYSQMYMLALGLHMAGPNLTPETFEQGMFAYPGGTGMFGTWGFGPGNYTPHEDTRIVWWDPDAVSTYNSKAGAYRESYGGQRFLTGQLPSGDPDAFNQ